MRQSNCLCGWKCIRDCCTTQPSQKLIRQKLWKYFNNEQANNINFNQQSKYVYGMKFISINKQYYRIDRLRFGIN